MLIVSWLARLSAFPIQDSEKEVSFDGSSYITYRLSTTKRTRQDRILLLFRTIKPSGLLLHAGGKKGNFMTLELIGGKLRYFNIVVFMWFDIFFPHIYLDYVPNTSKSFQYSNVLAKKPFHYSIVTREKNVNILLKLLEIKQYHYNSYFLLYFDEVIQLQLLEFRTACCANRIARMRRIFSCLSTSFLDIIML